MEGIITAKDQQRRLGEELAHMGEGTFPTKQ